MRTLLLISLFVILKISNCTEQKSILQTGIETINFGSGGGFTGLVTTYSISTDGQLIKIEKEKKTTLKTIDKKTLKEIFEKANELKSYQFNQPENMYSFIEIQTKENKQNITWGFGSTKVDNRVTELYNKLINLTKQS